MLSKLCVFACCVLRARDMSEMLLSAIHYAQKSPGDYLTPIQQGRTRLEMNVRDVPCGWPIVSHRIPLSLTIVYTGSGFAHLRDLFRHSMQIYYKTWWQSRENGLPSRASMLRCEAHLRFTDCITLHGRIMSKGCQYVDKLKCDTR